jgi:hypothetical protein
VLQGGDDRVTIRNYGDDNALSGDASAMRAVFDVIKTFLHAEEEDPPKFLGFLHTPDGWKLGVESYLTKTYLNERAPGTSFRKYPYFGWREKRAVYTKHGVELLRNVVFPAENYALMNHGLPWSEVLKQAMQESYVAAERGGVLRSPSWLLGKDYMMSAEDKIATGLYEGLYPSETKRMISFLLGKEWKGAW